jgi:hypothetical protein
MPIAVRLVKGREMLAELQDRIDRDGVYLGDGPDMVVHPGVRAIAQLESKVASMERALALSVPSRNAALPKQDREQRIRRPGRPGRPYKGSKAEVELPKLRLA